jgi:hypothetical protein
MKTITPCLQNLIDRLKITEEIYRKGSSQIGKGPITCQMELLAEDKSTFFGQIAWHLEIYATKQYACMSKRLTKELKKVAVEVDGFVTQMTEREVLGFCISKEEELINGYQQVLDEQVMVCDLFLKGLVKLQLNQSALLVSELRETEQAYYFLHK